MDLLEGDAGVDPWQHWYYIVKADAMVRRLATFDSSPSRIVDVGAGSGFFSEYLTTKWSSARATCVDPYYTDAQLAESTDRLTFTRDGDATGDTYLFMDVLEHVEDDQALLRPYVERAPRGAKFYITVPAFQMLWSAHDVYLKHFRRYRLKEIEQVVDQCGLKLLDGRYLYGATFPAVAGVRMLGKLKQSDTPKSDMKQQSDFANHFAQKVLLKENALRKNRIAGSTAAVLAIKA